MSHGTRTWLLVLSIVASAAAIPAQLFAQSFAEPAPVERFTLASKTGVLRKVMTVGDRVYVLDTQNHRILVYDGKNVTTVGGIGNGNGDLYQPFDFTVDDGHRLYVKDAGNHRIEMFDSQERYLGAFPEDPKSLGLAVNAQGEIFLGQPKLGHLITAYDTKGKRRRSFGALVRPSAINGPAFKRFDAYTPAFNRVRLATDEAGNIWAAFVYLPLVYKFDAHGNLLLQKRLQYPELTPIVSSVAVQPPAQDYASMNFDGLQLTIVVRDISYDRRTKSVFLLLGNERTVVLDAGGRDLYGLRPSIYLGNLQNLTVRDNGDILATVFASPNVYRFPSRKEVKR
jgi:hypothetical protein